MSYKDTHVALLSDEHGASEDAAPKLKSPKETAAARRARIQLTIAMIFCFLFMAGEVVGGYLAHSLAIMTE